MTKDPRSPFNWRMDKTPSIFAQDPSFCARKDGKSNAEMQTAVVERKRLNGENPGTIYNLGKQTKEKEEQILAYRQFGIFSKVISIKHPNKHEK